MKTTKDFNEIINLAIGEEKKAQKLYKDLADSTNDPFKKAILEGLYEQEILHEEKLRSLLSSIDPSPH